MNDTFSYTLTIHTSMREWIFKSIHPNHINQPDRVIRYLKFTLHNHTNESFPEEFNKLGHGPYYKTINSL